MRKYIIVIFCIVSISLQAQEKETFKKKNQFEFSTGYTIGALQNLAFAPVQRYDYNALNYQFKYGRITKREKLFEVQLVYLNSELETTIIPEPSPQYSKIVLNFSSLKQVYKNEKLKVHIGLQTQTNVSSYFDWKQYDFQQKLGIAGRFYYQWNQKHAVSSKITIPFVMWRSSTFEENFYALGKYQSILWTTEYKYTISNHFDLKADYTFNYDRLQIFNAFRELQYQINLGINYKF